MSFAFSSSSDSEDDDDRPVSYARNTEFIDQICRGTYESQYCEWPNELHCKCNFAGQQHANHSMAQPPHVNGFANSSMFDTSHQQQMNGSRILDSSAILNTTQEEDFVLVKVGDKFQKVRVVTDTEILQSAGTSEQRPVVSRQKKTHTHTSKHRDWDRLHKRNHFYICAHIYFIWNVNVARVVVLRSSLHLLGVSIVHAHTCIIYTLLRSIWFHSIDDEVIHIYFHSNAVNILTRRVLCLSVELHTTTHTYKFMRVKCDFENSAIFN